MSLSASLTNVGHPVAYYPRLARFFGSVNVAILFAQLHYWSQRGESDLGTHKSSEQFTEETGLSYREQVTARKQLREAGFLVETHRRLEHRVYYRLNLEAVDAAFDAWTEAQTAHSPNDENAVRENTNPQSGSDAERTPGADSSLDELRQTQSVINTETPHKTPTETPSIAAQAGAKAAGGRRKEVKEPKEVKPMMVNAPTA
jgi:hypothetical protein